MNGYKTYTGIAIVVLGWLGLANLVSEGELAAAIDNGIQLFGILVAVYGRYKAKLS